MWRLFVEDQAGHFARARESINAGAGCTFSQVDSATVHEMRERCSGFSIVGGNCADCLDEITEHHSMGSRHDHSLLVLCIRLNAGNGFWFHKQKSTFFRVFLLHFRNRRRERLSGTRRTSLHGGRRS